MPAKPGLTLKQVLQKAIEREIASQKLYADLALQAPNQAGKEALEELARQERGHRELLEKYQRGELKGGALHAENVIDYKIAESADLSMISHDMEIKDVFLLAATREQAAHDGYSALAAAHPAGRVKKLLEDIASQELTHKHRIEFLYTEVAFPQTDGG